MQYACNVFTLSKTDHEYNLIKIVRIIQVYLGPSQTTREVPKNKKKILNHRFSFYFQKS